MDGSMTSWVTGFLPTWDYGWQFSVNLDPPVQRSLVDLSTLVVGLVALGVTAGAMAAAARWDTYDPRRSRSTGR